MQALRPHAEYACARSFPALRRRVRASKLAEVSARNPPGDETTQGTRA